MWTTSDLRENVRNTILLNKQRNIMKNQRIKELTMALALIWIFSGHLYADITLAIGPATNTVAPRMSFVTRTTSCSSTHTVGAFSLALIYDPAIVWILSVTPATGSPFVDNMFVDSESFVSGRTRIVAFQTQTNQPVDGEQVICAVRWLPVGANSSNTNITAVVETFIDAEWKPLTVTALPSQLTITDADSDGDGMADVWEVAHGLNEHDPSDALCDTDVDGLSNLNEFKADTDPRNRDSNFQVAATEANDDEFIIRFTTVLGRVYRVEVSDCLRPDIWFVLIDSIDGTGNVVEVRDARAADVHRRFYRAVTQ